MDYGAFLTVTGAFVVAICAGAAAGMIVYSRATADISIAITRTVDAKLKDWHGAKRSQPKRDR